MARAGLMRVGPTRYYYPRIASESFPDMFTDMQHRRREECSIQSAERSARPERHAESAGERADTRIPHLEGENESCMQLWQRAAHAGVSSPA